MNPHGVRTRRFVILCGLRLKARIGIREGEADVPQPIVVDARLEVRKEAPSGPGALAASWAPEAEHRDAVCYDTLAVRFRGTTDSRVWGLAEDLADALVEACLEDRRVLGVRLRVRKPNAIPDADAGGVEVEAVREASPVE